MTKDFKKSESSSQSGQYGISWVLGGVAVGLLAGAIVYAVANRNNPVSQVLLSPADTRQNVEAPPATADSIPPDPQASLQDTSEEAVSRPGFSYHAVLPQLELDVPFQVQEQEPEADPDDQLANNRTDTAAMEQTTAALEQADRQQAAAEQQVAAQAAAPPTLASQRVMFQLGAYRDQRQAELLRQRCSNSGLNSRVEEAQVKGQTWYRVRLGPTDSMEVVTRWQQMLSSMGINPMIIRM